MREILSPDDRDGNGQDINIRIARLSPMDDVVALFGYVTEYRAVFHLDDAAQMERVHESLSGISDIRARLQAEFPQAPTEVIPAKTPVVAQGPAAVRYG